MKVTCTKKSGSKTAARAPKGAAITSFNLQDNGDDTCTVLGTDAAGNTLALDGVATITVSSDTPATLTVDSPIGLTFAMHAAGPIGTAIITVVATWTDGSVGPFTVSLPVTTQTGPANSVQIVPGTPTVH